MKNLILGMFLFSCTSIFSQGFVKGIFSNHPMNYFTVADFNGDQYPDIFSVDANYSGDNEISLFINEGIADVNFSIKNIPEQLDVQGDPAAGDIDGDGDIDIVVSIGENLDLFLMTNDGDANFTYTDLEISGSTDLKLGQLNSDGKLDIVGINDQTDEIFVYTSSFSSYVAKEYEHESKNVVDFELGDVDGNGYLDILVAFDHYEGIQILELINGGFGFFNLTDLVEDQFDDIMDMTIMDLNEDGVDDIIAVEEHSCTAWISGSFWPFVDETTLFTYSNNYSGLYRSLAVADYNSDGFLDVLTGDNEAGIVWHKSTSDTYEFQNIFVHGSAPVFRIKNADLDLDGDLDIVISNGEISYFLNETDLLNNVDVISSSKLQAKPNPFKNELSIIGILDNSLIEVYNSSGTLLYKEAYMNSNLDLSHLPNGVYFLLVKNEEGTVIGDEMIIKNSH